MMADETFGGISLEAFIKVLNKFLNVFGCFTAILLTNGYLL